MRSEAGAIGGFGETNLEGGLGTHDVHQVACHQSQQLPAQPEFVTGALV